MVPVEPIGQLTATQLPKKYGLDVVALIAPLKPASHAQVGRSASVESAGQYARTQLPEKYGHDVVALIAPLKPASHAQSPVGTSVPVESDGHPTAAQLSVVVKSPA